MELETPLNKAHFLVREAERLLKKGKFEEAVKQQDKIVTLLEAAKAESRDNKVTESIELQIKHHIRQKVVIAQRQSRCEKYTKDLKNLQLKMAKANLLDAGLQVDMTKAVLKMLSTNEFLQDSIYRTFQETESLLQHLKEAPPSDPSTGAKMPKDDKIIIEELSTANNHLRGMVEAMFAELETYKRENGELRSRISDLEAERSLHQRGGGSPPALNLGLQRQVDQDLLQDSGHLPPLAPLELPDFDYGASSSASSDKT